MASFVSICRAAGVEPRIIIRHVDPGMSPRQVMAVNHAVLLRDVVRSCLPSRNRP
jgi:hypothetical protein